MSDDDGDDGKVEMNASSSLFVGDSVSLLNAIAADQMCTSSPRITASGPVSNAWYMPCRFSILSTATASFVPVPTHAAI